MGKYVGSQAGELLKKSETWQGQTVQPAGRFPRGSLTTTIHAGNGFKHPLGAGFARHAVVAQRLAAATGTEVLGWCLQIERSEYIINRRKHDIHI